MSKKYIFNPKQLLLVIIIAAAGLTGCKKFLDINQNPNNPDSADPNLLLPTTQAAVSQIVGNAFQIYGSFWAQYWTQNPTSSQYRSIDQYNPAATAFDRPWLILYRNALINADLIIKSPQTDIDHTKGIAYIMKAYAYQLTTDAFGDVPLKEALQPTLYTSPKFDSQQSVYDSIFKYIDLGLGLVQSGTSVAVGNQDMIFKGNMDSWVAFANTLKLRAYLRIANVDAAKAQAGIEALYATSPTFLNADATITYTTTGGNENPLYNEMASPTLNKVQNIVASSTSVDTMYDNNDLRVEKLYDIFLTDTASEGNRIRSIAQGTYNNTLHTGKQVSPPSPLVGGRANNQASATAPVKLISKAESKFLQAEAAARGWGNGSAPSLYAEGIAASFTALGLTTGQADAYILQPVVAYPEGASLDEQMEAIITQKWYAMNGFQGFEAWTEWRRTGYPNFLVQSAASTQGAGRMPLRMTYPNSEAVSNLNYPGTVSLFTPVWWDTIHD
ncbi:SusD/RagB family nutrient-binding outer membrane lipoprotein [Mucilaginibacter hurinus]|uniref:SusD/RagB family nutrient-binding outer membrane lipoprotein n=1 Tax=Mucilaginibacter hurinus TaxID=2201324 RepID=A0A367GQI8_9SPHI|nr:SusD/RagB family nutrient-binding outer membrane lipoprotein [Mucilaginibacter hurinus]RCH55719.1 SusD/RagB family nutrient-binding outer membrane lipoprotein [Mucilaginibacter hurinus]